MLIRCFKRFLKGAKFLRTQRARGEIGPSEWKADSQVKTDLEDQRKLKPKPAEGVLEG